MLLLYNIKLESKSGLYNLGSLHQSAAVAMMPQKWLLRFKAAGLIKSRYTVYTEHQEMMPVEDKNNIINVLWDDVIQNMRHKLCPHIYTSHEGVSTTETIFPMFIHSISIHFLGVVALYW